MMIIVTFFTIERKAVTMIAKTALIIVLFRR